VAHVVVAMQTPATPPTSQAGGPLLELPVDEPLDDPLLDDPLLDEPLPDEPLLLDDSLGDASPADEVPASDAVMDDVSVEVLEAVTPEDDDEVETAVAEEDDEAMPEDDAVPLPAEPLLLEDVWASRSPTSGLVAQPAPSTGTASAARNSVWGQVIRMKPRSIKLVLYG